jgi:hypothetical protein
MKRSNATKKSKTKSKAQVRDLKPKKEPRGGGKVQFSDFHFTQQSNKASATLH